ncbi:hypothetical protein E2C01_049870 [Portunus trituberculatus]|uniref:Uncharacterized protein n=1 Tax=Portunus trituberculatus TaxID=210409 RepID=A0A5B7GHA1_PORTR|nr:hypothetical protein [Portunus trituberculatus]
MLVGGKRKMVQGLVVDKPLQLIYFLLDELDNAFVARCLAVTDADPTINIQLSDASPRGHTTTHITIVMTKCASRGRVGDDISSTTTATGPNRSRTGPSNRTHRRGGG